MKTRSRSRWQPRTARPGGTHLSAGLWYRLRGPHIPDRRTGDPERRTGQPPGREDLPADRVLVVDDQANVRRMMARMLEESGFDVAEAGGGAEALEQCAREAFAVVIADVRMPRMDGIELGRHIVEHWPHTQMLYVTGYPGEESEVPGRLLTKPFSGEELIAIVRSLGDEYRRSADDKAPDNT